LLCEWAWKRCGCPCFAVAQWTCPAIAEPEVFSNPALSLALGVIACIFGNLQRSPFHDFHIFSATIRAPAIMGVWAFSLLIALAGNATKAKKLVKSGVDPNFEVPVSPGSQYGYVPLNYLIAVRNLNAIRILVEVGADLESKPKNESSPLISAIGTNDPELVTGLLKLRPFEKLSPNTQGRLLFVALEKGAPNSLEALLKSGVPIDTPDAAGMTLLMRAMERKDANEIVSWLLEHGAKPL